jgi:2-polyprenyl-3-methyl-5-hydroxy-6-metoxy-1,4-benzoquinol methylase
MAAKLKYNALICACPPISKKMNRTRSKDKQPEYFQQSRTEMLPYIPASAASILDVGCGEGRFGSTLKGRACEVWGIEIEEDAAKKAAEYLDNVLVGDVRSQIDRLPNNYFDCIVFNDILEHLLDPCKILEAIGDKLKNGGFVVSSIPNVRYYENMKNLLIKKQWEYEKEGILDYTHIRFFTEKSIREMFRASGYEVVRMQGINAMNWSWKLRLLSALLMGYINDMKYLQYACVARKSMKY